MVKSAHDKIKHIVNNRVVAIMSHGKSIEELENRITEFKDYDICWTSFNYYSLMEDFILSKINKKLEIILEGADSDNVKYETDFRIPKMLEVIRRGNIPITTWKLMRTEYHKKGLQWFYNENKDNIVLADHLLDIINAPNTLSLLIYCIAVCEPKKIIMFGVDGYKGSANDDEYSTYYKPEFARQRRARQLKHRKNFTLKETSDNFETDFYKHLNLYCNKYNIKAPEIINCSPNSLFTCFKKANYESIKREL